MKIDLFTKFLLTVIAACLVWQSVQPLISPSVTHAQQAPAREQAQPVKVVVVGWEGPERTGIPVVITDKKVPVEIVAPLSPDVFNRSAVLVHDPRPARAE